MEHSQIHLDDLPTEILMIILKNLNNCDVLYSLIGVNKRLNTIANDLSFTKNLTLTTPHGLCQFTDTILDRFCLEILLKINDKIECLDVESSSMERILLSTNYPSLHTLGIYDLSPETAGLLFTHESYLIRHFQNQISSLYIKMKRREELRQYLQDTNIYTFCKICNLFKNLQYLNFSSSDDFEQLTFVRATSVKFSSNLLELHVVVKTIEDCLYLLNGHFNQLHTFYVKVNPHGAHRSPMINHDNKLPNLRCFSLIYESGLLMQKEVYNKDVVRLIQRMSNLEELNLCFTSFCDSIINGDHLEKTYMNYMKRLNKFTFNIRSVIPHDEIVNLPSNEDIQNTFKNFKNNKIISSMDYLLKQNLFFCHIYSYPYIWSIYDHITNNFPGGLFKYVREISLYDVRPFEHDFFLRIVQSFPFIKKINLHNDEPQENVNQQHLIIKYNHLMELNLARAHDNYIEQFLNNTKTCLLNDIYLCVDYDALEKVTDNFTKDETRNNCLKIIRLIMCASKAEIWKAKDYFPNAEIY